MGRNQATGFCCQGRGKQSAQHNVTGQWLPLGWAGLLSGFFLTLIKTCVWGRAQRYGSSPLPPRRRDQWCSKFRDTLPGRVIQVLSSPVSPFPISQGDPVSVTVPVYMDLSSKYWGLRHRLQPYAWHLYRASSPSFFYFLLNNSLCDSTMTLMLGTDL